MRDHVSSHAIIRYVERVLHQPVDAWLNGKDKMLEAEKAAMVCELAGVPVAAVRELILCPPVLAAVKAGFSNVTVRFDGFAYPIRNGVVLTVVTERMRDERTGCANRLREMSEAEIRRKLARDNRRFKDRNRMKDRRRLEGAE